jgi:hypothetical protein
MLFGQGGWGNAFGPGGLVGMLGGGGGGATALGGAGGFAGPYSYGLTDTGFVPPV